MIKKALLFGMFLMISPASAEIVHKMSSSVQLTVDAAASQASRIGSSYTVSGNNLKVSDGGSFGGLGTLTSGTAVGYTPSALEVNTVGSAFSMSETYIEGDDVTSSSTVSGGVVAALPLLGSTTTTSGGVAGTLAGTITSAGVTTITGGGAGTSATGQFLSLIHI